MVSVQFIYMEENAAAAQELERRLAEAFDADQVAWVRAPILEGEALTKAALLPPGDGQPCLHLVLLRGDEDPEALGLNRALQDLQTAGFDPENLARVIRLGALSNELERSVEQLEPVPATPLRGADEDTWGKLVKDLHEEILTLGPLRLRGVELSQLTSFEALELEFSDGINLFVGENGTGKTHLLKFLYSMTAEYQEGLVTAPGRPLVEWEYRQGGMPKLMRVFKPAEQGLLRLRRLGGGAGETKGSLHFSDDHHCSWAVKADSSGEFVVHTAGARTRGTVFIPSREALAMFEGFMAAYQRRELSFDETYYDLCLALSASPLRGEHLEAQRPLIERLESILGGKVQLRGGRFYLEQGADTPAIEAHLLAEGHRKLATLVQLLRNGSLRPGSMLFWDEPEANLNPQLIPMVVEILQALAAAGVQIFVATHDYLLSHRLSLAAEYRISPRVPMRFFSFYRPEPDAGVEVEWADTLAGIEHNPILDGFAALYDLESRLFTEDPVEE